MKKVLLTLSVVLGLVALLPASVFASTGETKVRVLHASPNAPAVDVFANGNKILSDVPFGTVSSYLTVPSGSYRIEVRPADKAGPTVIDTHVHLGKNRWYTLAASGNLESIELLQFRDKDKNGQEGTPRLRVIHLSPNAPRVDLATEGNKTIIRHLGFTESSNYKRIDQGTYTFQVRLTGTDTTVLTVPGVTLNNGVSATVYAVGLAGGSPGLSAILAVDAQ